MRWPLTSTLGDEEYVVREAAAVAIVKLQNMVLGPVMKKLRNKYRFVHNGTVGTREREKGSFTIEPLAKALRDECEVNRLTAAAGLGRIGGPRAMEAIMLALGDRNRDIRTACVQALGWIGGTRIIEPLILSLRDEDARVRWDAAEAIGAIGGKKRSLELYIIAALQNAEDTISEEVKHVFQAMREAKEHETLYSENWEG